MKLKNWEKKIISKCICKLIEMDTWKIMFKQLTWPVGLSCSKNRLILVQLITSNSPFSLNVYLIDLTKVVINCIQTIGCARGVLYASFCSPCMSILDVQRLELVSSIRNCMPAKAQASSFEQRRFPLITSCWSYYNDKKKGMKAQK